MLFKNFWKHFKIYKIQLIALFFMIVTVITLLGGQLIHSNWTNDQLKQLDKDHLTSSYINGNYDIKDFLDKDHLYSSETVLFSNINYIDDDKKVDLNRFEKAIFRLEKDDQNRVGVYRFIVNDNKTIKLVDEPSLLKNYLSVDKNNNYVFYFKPDFIDESFQYQNLLGIKNKTNTANLFISSHVIEQLIGKTLPLISVKKSVFDFSSMLTYQQMIKPYQDDLKIADINQDDILYLNKLLINTLLTTLHTKETQYAYYLDINDILTNLKKYIIPIDAKQKLLAPILLSGRLAQNDQEIVINPTYSWNHHLKINDVINLFDKTYKIVGFATSIFINNNFHPLASLSNSIYYWVDKKEYESIAQIYSNSQHFLLNASFLRENNLNQSTIDTRDFIEKKFKRIFFDFNLVFLHIHGENMGSYPHLFAKDAYAFAKVKKRDLAIIISIFSLLVLIAAFVMISIIVNKIIYSNKKVIGNLKTQGYSSLKIALALSNCFLLFTIACCLISLITAWTFGMILNYTYINFFEFIQWLPIPDLIFIFCCLIVPCIIVYFYCLGFITILTSYRPLVLMSDYNKTTKKIFKLNFLTRWFKKANFKHKVSLWFIVNSKWKVLLTLIITFLNSAILFSIYSFFKQTDTVQNNINDNYWKYLYSYRNNNLNQYDFKAYSTKKDVKTKANEINATNFLTLSDLKNKWISVENLKKLARINKINNYQYIIDNLERNDGIITFGYQPYIKNEEILGYKVNPWNYRIEQIEKANKAFITWENEQKNKIEKQGFLEWIFDQNCQAIKKSLCRSQSFISSRPSRTVIDFNSNKLPNNNFDLLKLELEHLNKTEFFKAKTINEIDFKNNEVKNNFKYNVLKWKTLFEKAKLKVDIFPVLVSKSLIKDHTHDQSNEHKINDLYLRYESSIKTINLYYVVDYFTNLTKELMFTNSLNNAYIGDNSVMKFSHLGETELNNFIGIYDKNNDYSIRNMLNTKNFNPIFEGQVNNESVLKSSRYSANLIKYILIIIIVIAVLGCFLQLTVVLNIIIRENIKYINIFKILGYSKLWIFNRLVLMYLPIIVIAYMLAIPLGVLFSFLSQNFIINNTIVYTATYISWINFVISAVSLVVIYSFSYMITMSYTRKKYPIYQIKNE